MPRLRPFIVITLFLTTSQITSAQLVFEGAYHLDHTLNGANIYASITSEGDPSNDALFRRLKAGDVGELMAVSLLADPLVLAAALDDASTREVTVHLETPGRVEIIEDAERSRLETKIYSTEGETSPRPDLIVDRDAVTLTSLKPTSVCAMSSVGGQLKSVLGTCAVTTISVAPGDRVTVYAEGLKIR